MINRKSILGLISILLSLLIGSFLLKTTGKLYRLPIASYGLILTHLILALSILIVSFYTIKNRTLLSPILIFVLIIIIGELSKRMHWTGAGIEIIIGYFGLLTTYSIRFILKKDKLTIDLIKWILITSTAIITPSVVLHWTGNTEFNQTYYMYIKEPLIWLLFLIFIIQTDLKKPITLYKKT